MIKYSLGISKKCNNFDSQPYIDIDEVNPINEDMHLSSEISHLSGEYTREIVQELEEVVEGTRGYTSFGYEITNIGVLKKGFKSPVDGKVYPNGLVYINYGYDNKELDTEIKIEEVLKMMTEWRDYIDAWEKETGKVYNGI